MYGEKLSTLSARGVVRFVVLKNSDSMSPTSPCCKQGLISAFIHGTSVWGVCTHVHWCVTSLVFSLSVSMCILLACVRALFPAVFCSTVQYLSSVCGEVWLEDDWRINAILKQNTTCQIFTPSLPLVTGWDGYDSEWMYRPWTKRRTGITLLQFIQTHSRLFFFFKST